MKIGLFFGGDCMSIKEVIQTLGTIASFVLAFITFKVTRNLLEINLLSLSDIFTQYGQFILMILTVGTMMATGFSYYNSRLEYDGINRFLYLCLALAHNVLAPISFVIAVLKIEFGEYWWATIVVLLILIYWSNQQKEARD